MGNVTNFVGCGCLRKYDEMTEVDENKSLNKKNLNIFKKKKKKPYLKMNHN